LKVLWLCFTESPVKKGLIELKAGIQTELELHKRPKKGSLTVDRSMNVTLIDIPNTGAGYDDWDWEDKAMVDLEKAGGNHLKESFDRLLEKDGIPATLASGVQEVSQALLAWTAEQPKV
jgi:hypothetical protein